jgi:hypothetical protein
MEKRVSEHNPISPVPAGKTVWTEADLDDALWHDCHVYAFAYVYEEFEFSMDVDFIFEWIKEPGRKYIQFRVAPATVVFEEVTDLELNVRAGVSDFELSGISREDLGKPQNAEFTGKQNSWKWTLSFQGGTITFKSTGFKLYSRTEPSLIDGQTLGLEARGGISFERAGA